MSWLIWLHPEIQPNNDIIAQADLTLNYMQSKMRGVNMSPRSATKSVRDIEETQNDAFLGAFFTFQVLGLPISTKIHLVMHHSDNQLHLFGYAKRGDSDINETLHKLAKSAYAAKNSTLSSLGYSLCLLERCQIQTFLYPLQTIPSHSFPKQFLFLLPPSGAQEYDHSNSRR